MKGFAMWGSSVRLGRWAVLVMAVIICNVGLVFAQGVDSGGGDITRQYLGSVGGIVLSSIFLTSLVKRTLGGVTVAAAIPVWVYVVAIAVTLTVVANRVLGTLQGDLVDLLIQGVYNAAAASGLREWIHAGPTKPMGDSL